MANDHALKVIYERNAFYRRMYMLALGALVVAYAVIITLCGVVYYLTRHPVGPRYFATDTLGRLINVIPVNKPNMSTEDVARWTINAIEKSNSYNYVNYRRQLQDVQGYFTSYGWRKFMAAIKSNNNLVALTDRKMIFEARVINNPKVVAEGILGGKYAWKFEMPMLVTYWLPPYDQQSMFQNAQNVSVIVQRQPILQSVDGLGIVQMVVNLATAAPGQQQLISDTPNG